MPYVSIIVPTMRVGGLDVLFDSLAKQSFTDFELVLVDALYSRRKDIVLRQARDRFISVRHVGLDPTPKFCAFCTFSNAGIVASSGEILLFMVDYSRLPRDLVAKHAAFHRADPTDRAGLMGPHRYLKLDVNPEFPAFGRQEIDRYDAACASGELDRFLWSTGRALEQPAIPHQADGGAIVPPDADPKLRMPAGPIGAEFFHAKNESIHRDRAIEINGWDQELDGAHLYQDSDFADRLVVKAGVQFTLDPTAVVEIVNPRHVFPFARRVRDHQENYAIWQRKKAAGYTSPPRRELHELPVRDEGQLAPSTEERIAAAAEKTASRKLRVAMIYGEFSSHGHGPYDVDGIYTKMGLTGSEGSFFNLARSLCERGHEVAVFCDTAGMGVHESGFNMVPIRELEKLPKVFGLDAVIAWNEPDYLRFAPPGVKRICDQQLNDFGYCRHPDWQRLVDVWVSPSENHRDNVMSTCLNARPDPVHVIPNSVDLDLFAGPAPVRNPRRVVWCSSPDRGLHKLLAIWPLVRRRVPDAELKIFYKLAPWIDRVRSSPDESGRRARYIEEVLPRLAGMGVEVVDLVSNARMAKELQAASCLAYPCDPIRYTEGFGCSVLDAAAAGCVPVISDADALPSVHGQAALVLRETSREAWAEAIVGILQEPMDTPNRKQMAERMVIHAAEHSRVRVAGQWEELLSAV